MGLIIGKVNTQAGVTHFFFWLGNNNHLVLAKKNRLSQASHICRVFAALFN